MLLIGADTPDGGRVLANLRGFPGALWHGEGEMPRGADLAIVAAAPGDVPGALRAVAAGGCGAAVVTAQVAGLGELAASIGVRVLGPSSFGLAVPALGLNASLSHMAPPAGAIALITQSAALARAVVDWAGPNGVGFSHVVGIGGNADLGFGAVLDVLSRDPGTKLILMDIRRVRDARAFISAARAASRLRPVVALRPGGRLLDETGRADAVFEAALTRAGVFTVHGLEAFLAAAETLSRAPALRGDAMAVVTNAIGPGRLAADAALRAGIALAVLPPDAQTTLTASLPADLLHGLVYAGGAAPTDVASIAAMVSAVPAVGGVLVLLAPTGPGDSTAVESVIAAAHTARLPVLTCVMGETTGAGHRRRLAEAGLPVFATPEQAVQAFSHLLRDRQARQAARELPSGRVLDVAPDHGAVARILECVGAAGRTALTGAESLAVLAAYGLASAPADTASAASVTVHEDATFGPVIGFSAGDAWAYGLPPLNLALARDLARSAGLRNEGAKSGGARSGGARSGGVGDAAEALVRVSQMLVDLPSLATLRVGALLLCEGGASVARAAITLHGPGRRARLAISPYPEQLAHAWRGGGQDFVIRPIRPEDAASHAALIGRVPPDDLRYRFFSAMRQVSPEQMARLTQIDYEREMAFVAVRASDGATVGVARLVRDGGPAGEFAILVQPDTKGLGLARHLMDCLIDWAQAQGLSRVTGQILADNHPMLAFVRRLGFSVHQAEGETDVLEARLAL